MSSSTSVPPLTLRPHVYDSTTSKKWLYSVLIIAFLGGFNLATWLTRLPNVKDALSISDAQLGLLLLASTVGSFTSVTVSGYVLQKIKSKTLIVIDGIIISIGLMGMGMSVSIFNNYFLTAFFLLLLGLGGGSLGVAMNIQGASCELVVGKPVMPKLHGSFSLGTLVGAIIGFIGANFSINLAVHYGIAGIFIAVVTLSSSQYLKGDVADEATHTLAADIRSGKTPDPRTKEQIADDPLLGIELDEISPIEATQGSASEKKKEKISLLHIWKEPRTLLLGVIVLGIALGEGAAGDWVAVSLVDTFHIQEQWGSFAYVLFVLFMTIGRFNGGKAINTLGNGRSLQTGALLAFIGIGLFIIAPLIFGQESPALFISYAAVIIWALGVCLGFPITMSVAADDPSYASARVSVVSTIGYLAFLAGPPLLGFIAELMGGARQALVIALIFVAISFFVVPQAMPIKKSQAASSQKNE